MIRHIFIALTRLKIENRIAKSGESRFLIDNF
jgi:hypothetical protein